MTEFVFDPYKNMTVEELKDRCRRLSRAYWHYQQIILILVERGLDALPPDWKEEVQSLQRAYSDD